MSTRLLVLPEMFAGEEDVDQWFEHFEDVAAVNAWEGDAMLLWLKVRLTGRARTAFQRLAAADTKGNYKEAKKALCERFEPPSKKELSLQSYSVGVRNGAKAGLNLQKMFDF